MERAEKFQFLSTAFGLFVAGIDGLANSNIFYVLVSASLILIGIFFVILAIFFQKFKAKFKNQSSRLVSIISGVFMTLTGISFGLMNSRSRIQYCYYLLGLAYFFLFPYIEKWAQKRRQITVKDTGIFFGKKIGKSVTFRWEQILNIKLTTEMLLIDLKNGKQKKFFWINAAKSDLSELKERFQTIADSQNIKFLAENN